jgi:hypothetical protein
MTINLQVNYLDETEKLVVAQAADLMAFETKFDLSVARLDKEVKLTHLLYIAYHAEKRTKGTDLEFEAWIETIAGIEAKAPKK